MDTYKFSKRKKLWVCGMTQDRIKDIEGMLTPELLDVTDGLIFTDGYSTDGTYDLLNEKKGEGKIVQRKWTNDHDFQMNEFLRAGVMQNGDWFFILDSPERVTPEWCKTVRGDIEEHEKNETGVVAASGRAYLAKYYDSMYFFPSPHWGLHGIIGKFANIEDKDKSKHVINTRDDDPLESYFLHPVKYHYCYGRSNHTSLMYGDFGSECVQFHENVRTRFRLYCQHELGLHFTLDSLEEFMRKGDFDHEFVQIVEMEYCLKDFYRLKVLNQTVEEVTDNRYNWSFDTYLQTKEINQSKSSFIGAINQYRKQAGMKPEEPGHVYEKLSL